MGPDDLIVEEAEILLLEPEKNIQLAANYDISSIYGCSTERSIDFSEKTPRSNQEQRDLDMFHLKIQLAYTNRSEEIWDRSVDFDFNYCYTKGLSHNSEGHVNPETIEKLITALKTQNYDLLQQVPVVAPLTNPSAAWSLDLIGRCNNNYRYSNFPSFSSPKMTSALLELYSMVLARDIPFKCYPYTRLIHKLCSYTHLNPYTIFRSPLESIIPGPYISQFLYLDIPWNHFGFPQQYLTFVDNIDYMTTWESVVAAQNGEVCCPQLRETPRYIITGRDLAWYVYHNDPAQAFLNASLILQSKEIPRNPYLYKPSTEYFYVDLGFIDLAGILHQVIRSSLLAAWYVKWNMLSPRPEKLGIEIERTKKNSLYEHPILACIRKEYGTSLLPQVYPEGSPNHPSYPSAHACIAGACITVLKFYFDIEAEMEVWEPVEDGSDLINTGKITTVEEELNKLASNICWGRLWAGVNFDFDAISGLKRGERVAIDCLSDLIKRYPFPVSVPIKRFNGKIENITNYK